MIDGKLTEIFYIYAAKFNRQVKRITKNLREKIKNLLHVCFNVCYHA